MEAVCHGVSHSTPLSTRLPLQVFTAVSISLVPGLCCTVRTGPHPGSSPTSCCCPVSCRSCSLGSTGLAQSWLPCTHMPPQPALLCCSRGVGPALLSAGASEGVGRLSCSATLRAGAPVPAPPPGSALLCCPGRVQALLSYSGDLGPALLIPAGGEEVLGTKPSTHPHHLTADTGGASSARLTASGLARPRLQHQGSPVLPRPGAGAVLLGC